MSGRLDAPQRSARSKGHGSFRRHRHDLRVAPERHRGRRHARLKAGSAAVLRGSANALESNRVIVETMRRALQEVDLPRDAVQLIDSPDRALVTELLEARGQVDLVIPRGGASLINHVVQNAKVPVIETGVGNCHVFVDASADLDNAKDIIINAKVQRPGVCNSVETLLVHQEVAEAFLLGALSALAEHGVSVTGCERTRDLFPQAARRHRSGLGDRVFRPQARRQGRGQRGRGHHPHQSLRHAAQRSHPHQVHRKRAALSRRGGCGGGLCKRFDALHRRVRVLVSGAEIGISTQKLHARGPMGLAEMVTHKYLIEGEGQIRG